MLRKALLFSVCTVVPLLIVEWYARQHFVDYVEDEAYFELAFNRLLNSLVIPATEQANSPLFGYALTPNARRTVTTDDFTYHIQTNSLGFRTREIAPRDGDEQRLLLFGDSMLFGVGLEEEQAVAGQLERISANAGQPLSVYNYAMLHFSTVQSLIAARAFAPQLAPNHMLLGIFVANDLCPTPLPMPTNTITWPTTRPISNACAQRCIAISAPSCPALRCAPGHCKHGCRVCATRFPLKSIS